LAYEDWLYTYLETLLFNRLFYTGKRFQAIEPLRGY
jgi:hypothetical protein